MGVFIIRGLIKKITDVFGIYPGTITSSFQASFFTLQFKTWYFIPSEIHSSEISALNYCTIQILSKLKHLL